MISGFNYDFEYEYFESGNNGVISDSIVQNWTQSALDCYKINCDCTICPITKAGYSFKCRMKNIIDILLRTKGEPDENNISVFDYLSEAA